MHKPVAAEIDFMRLALRLARRGYGQTSPNPMVGAVLVKKGKIIGRGWHRRAGEPHAEILTLRMAESCGIDPRGATLYATLEPCCTHGRTPPCTEAIKASGIKRLVIAATDPNPSHAGKGLRILEGAGITVVKGLLQEEAMRLNEAFNHWIVQRTPFVIVKAAMSFDGKLATRTGESKWITSHSARAYSMHLRRGADAILVGVNTIITDNPSLTIRPGSRSGLRRIILDSDARTPVTSKVVTDAQAALTTIVVSRSAPSRRARALSRRVHVCFAPARNGKIDLKWLLDRLGAENVTALLVEGGGEVNASFLLGGRTHRIAFFYAPKIIGGRDAVKVTAGEGVQSVAKAVRLKDVEYRQVGPDLLLLARVVQS